MRRQPKARTTKSKSRQDDFYVIKEKAQNRRRENKVELEINMERMGSKIIELHKISKKFKDHIILDNFSFDFQRGERIGIIGKNGTGKSTFLNLLTGTLPLDGGKVIKGDTIKIGYYTQSGINPKPGQKVIDIINELVSFQVKVDLIDPHASSDEMVHEYGIGLIEKTTNDYDAIIVAVNHKEYKSYTEQDFKNLLKDQKGLFVDVKGIFKGKINDLEYWSL
jgi:energy-coupling factor transporter ATP-binding protein EcfA2